jgi:hypothetical protein
MLVHPSRETPGQVSSFTGSPDPSTMGRCLDLTEERERSQFQTVSDGIRHLQATLPDLPTFDELSRELHYAIRKTEVLEVNAVPRTGTPQPDWRITYPWILVGGQAMDRGFTVEGLTVTYMPRDMGVGNADTIQQRARFFGYKRGYLGFCRVFLERGLHQAFQFYVAHERDIRQRLQEHRGRPLSEWRRAFFMDTSLRPTRRQVLNIDYRQDTFSDDWFWPKVPHGPADLVESNRQTIQRFATARHGTRTKETPSNG